MRAAFGLCLIVLTLVGGVPSTCVANSKGTCIPDENALVQKEMSMVRQTGGPEDAVGFTDVEDIADAKPPKKIAGTLSEDYAFPKVYRPNFMMYADQKVRVYRDLGHGLTVKTWHKGDTKNYPKSGDEVQVHYIGRLATNGESFDSNEKGEEPFKFNYKVNRLIDGWEMALEGMTIGEKAEIYVPAALGYGEQGANGIPANSDLVFTVELLTINGLDYHGRIAGDFSEDSWGDDGANIDKAARKNYTDADIVENKWLTKEELDLNKKKGEKQGNLYAPAIDKTADTVSKAMNLEEKGLEKLRNVTETQEDMEDVSEQASTVAQETADFVTDREHRKRIAKDLYYDAGEVANKKIQTRTDHGAVYKEATKENVFHHKLNPIEEGVHKCMYQENETKACGIMVAMPQGAGRAALKGSAAPSESAPTNLIAQDVMGVDAMTLWYTNENREKCCASYKLLFENPNILYYENIFAQEVPDDKEHYEDGIKTTVKYYCGLNGIKKEACESLCDKFCMPKAHVALMSMDDAPLKLTLKKILHDGKPSLDEVVDRMYEEFGDEYPDKKNGASKIGVGLLAAVLGAVAFKL